jgi:DUF1365 family protein
MTPSGTCFYEGIVEHTRVRPVRHRFTFPLGLACLDLAELPARFGRFGFWSTRFPAWARFRRADYLGDPRQPLDDAVRDLVEAKSGERPTGPIRLLTNFRQFGFGMNPVSFYYCQVSENPADGIRALVAEVNNTPWNEQHVYLLDRPEPIFSKDATDPHSQLYQHRNPKDFHVSPFMAMALQYHWLFSAAGETLTMRIDNHDEQGLLFTARMTLRRVEWTRWNSFSHLVRYPLQTWRIFAAIYWQAWRLYRRGVPYVPHPGAAPSPSPGGLS